MPLVTVLARMENEGVRVDRAHFARLSAETKSRLEALTAEIHGIAGRPFNIASPKQLSEILFEELKLPKGRKTASGGYSTDMAVLEVAGEPAGFHARFSATARHYAYRMLLAPDPLRRRDHWLVHGPLDVAAMSAAAALLLGEHDCTSFCVARSHEPGRMLCRIQRAELVHEPASAALTLHIAADRFVHSMVRSIAGTLVEVGRGRRTPGSISTTSISAFGTNASTQRG